MRLPHPHPLQAPNALESLASLLMRTKRDNYYEEANWLDSLLPLPVLQNLNLLERSEQFARLSELTELSVDILWRCTLHSLAQCYILPSQLPWEAVYSSPEGRPIWDASRLAMYVHGHLATKLCPLCWRENRSILLPWSLRHVTTCARHQVLLVDHCTQCGSSLQANWEKGVCHACQSSLADLPVISLAGHAASTAVTAIIWSALGCSDESFAPSSLNLAPDHLVQTLSAPALLEFLWYFGQLLLARDPEWPLFAPDLLLPGTAWSSPPTILRQASVAEVHGVLTALWQLLDGWPKTWEMTLERLVEIEGPFATDTPQRFPHLLTTQFSAPEFAWLYRGWEDFMWKHRSSKASLYPWLRHWRRTQQLQEAHLGPSLLSRREAAQRLHRSERTLRQLLELERLQTPPIPDTESGMSKRQWHLIEAESIERVQHVLEEELTLTQAAAVCGVSHGTVLQLVKAGLLPALRGPGMQQGPVWVFDTAAIREALAHLIGHLPVRSVPAPKDHGSHSLSSAMRVVSAAAITLPEVLQSLHSGQLTGFRLSDDVTLATLRMERVHLAAFMAERRGVERGDMLATDEVRRLLHCSATTFNAGTPASSWCPPKRRALEPRDIGGIAARMY